MEKTSGHIRFGIICESEDLYAWQKTTIQNLVSEDDIDLELVVTNQNPLSQKHAEAKSSRLWRFFYKHRVETKSAALKIAKSDDVFQNIHIEKSDFISADNETNELPPKTIELLKKAELDFVIDFSTHSCSGAVLAIPKHGVWNFQFSNPQKYQKDVSCFWEIYKQDNVTSAYLQRLTEDSSVMEVLHEGHLKTSVSYRKNFDKIVNECAYWPLKMCENLRANKTKITSVSKPINTKKLWHVPNNLQTLFFPLVQLKLRFKQIWTQLFFTDLWNIGIVNAPIQDFLNTTKKPKVHWFPDQLKDRFMADPFGMFYKNQLHIIYEDLKFDEGIGKTARFLYDQETFKENEIVIDEPFHMSYPFLFEKDGENYCIPETYQANHVGLYKALDFPFKWKFEKVLIENYAGIDSTAFEHEGTWYLFSTDKNHGPHYNLNIHYASDCFGPWQAHPKNPVKTDIRSARPAGTLFENQGEIYRPSMDYSEKIEGRITLNKVEILSKQDFKEVAHQLLQPFENCYYSDKVHTLSQVGEYTLVDGAKELFVLSNFKAFKYKMKRVLNKLKGK